MPRTIVPGILAAALLATAPVGEPAAQGRAGDTLSAGLHASTLGLGLSVGYDFSSSFAARALVSRYDYDYDDEQDGDTYRGELKLASQGLLLDWYPFGGMFRLTGGILRNGNELSATAEGADLTIGDVEGYSGNVRAQIDFDDVATYLGIGWTTGRRASGFSFMVGIGVLFQDAPHLSARATLSRGTGTNCTVSVNEAGVATLRGGANCQGLFDAELKRDIEEEHRELTEDLKDFDAYPVLLLGASYRF